MLHEYADHFKVLATIKAPISHALFPPARVKRSRCGFVADRSKCSHRVFDYILGQYRRVTSESIVRDLQCGYTTRISGQPNVVYIDYREHAFATAVGVVRWVLWLSRWRITMARVPT